MLAHPTAATYAAAMRTLVVPLMATLLSGCTFAALAEPSVHVSPYLALYQLRGKTSVDSFADPNSPTTIQSNAPQAMRNFGQDRHREDLGIRANLGDGFAGLHGEYYRLDMDTARRGQLEQSWGNLQQGDLASVAARMDEFRLGYIEQIAEMRTDYRDDELRLQIGAGGTITSRAMDLRARESTNARQQSVKASGDAIFVALRARASWRDFSLDLDYAASPSFLALTGDIDGLSQDVEARLTYRLPQRDIRFFAGMRYSVFSASGNTGPFRYDSEFLIDGLQFGITVTL
jgi:hypothetical protein